jgi:hypothetical protein
MLGSPNIATPSGIANTIAHLPFHPGASTCRALDPAAQAELGYREARKEKPAVSHRKITHTLWSCLCSVREVLAVD